MVEAVGDSDGVELVPSSDTSSGTRMSDSRMEEGDQIGTEAEQQDALKRELAERQTRTVFWLRVLVIASLLIAMLVVCITVYSKSRDAELDEFEAHFEGISAKVIQAFDQIVEQKLLAVGSVEVAAIAQSLGEERGWPFVTLSAFQERAASARSLSKSLFLSINPIVNDTDRSEWEDYVGEEDWM